MNIHDLYRDIITAANTAKKWSNKHNKRGKELDIRGLSSIEKDDDYWLKKYYARYCFWKDEQQRIGDLLKCHLAYIELDRLDRVGVIYGSDND